MTFKHLKIIGRIPFEETQVGMKPCIYVEGRIKRVMCHFLKFFFHGQLKQIIGCAKSLNLTLRWGIILKI